MAVEEMTPAAKRVGLTGEFDVNPRIWDSDLTQLGASMSTTCKQTFNHPLRSPPVTNRSSFVRLVFTAVKCVKRPH